MSKVLIIEDELSTARPVQEALKINGIDAEIAQNGLQGNRTTMIWFCLI